MRDRSRLGDEAGMVGRLVVAWLLVLAIIAMAAIDSVSIVITRLHAGFFPMRGTINPPPIEPIERYTIPRYEMFALGGREALRSISDTTKSEVFAFASSYPSFPERDGLRAVSAPAAPRARQREPDALVLEEYP